MRDDAATVSAAASFFVSYLGRSVVFIVRLLKEHEILKQKLLLNHKCGQLAI